MIRLVGVAFILGGTATAVGVAYGAHRAYLIIAVLLVAAGVIDLIRSPMPGEKEGRR